MRDLQECANPMFTEKIHTELYTLMEAN